MDQTSDHGKLKDALQARLGYRFTVPDLLDLALTHRSWAEERGGGYNERLEFLGDAVVQLVVTAYLMDRYPDAQEGQLHRVRSSLVGTSTLAGFGRDWGLGVALRLGRGEAATGGADKDSLLANTVEAVLGAIYQDGGLAPCREALVPCLDTELEGVHDPSQYGVDAKSALQELTLAHWKLRPKYAVVGMEGPAHARVFHVEVHVAKFVTTTGSGSSKQDAQQVAAATALEELRAQIAAEE